LKKKKRTWDKIFNHIKRKYGKQLDATIGSIVRENIVDGIDGSSDEVEPQNNISEIEKIDYHDKLQDEINPETVQTQKETEKYVKTKTLSQKKSVRIYWKKKKMKNLIEMGYLLCLDLWN